MATGTAAAIPASDAPVTARTKNEKTAVKGWPSFRTFHARAAASSRGPAERDVPAVRR